MRSSLATRIAAVTLSLGLVACASSEDLVNDGDTAGADAAADTAGDTNRDASDADAESDAAEDAGTDVVDDTGTDTPPDTPPDVPDDDAESDTVEFDCEVLAGECEPTAVFCSDVATVGYCSRCGEVLFEETCETGSVCDDTSGIGSCRECVGDECPDNVECVAGERSCLDFETVQVCGADGLIDTVSPCPAGRRCFDGSCGPDGLETGANCLVDVDAATGCAGQLCVCGAEWVETNGADTCRSGLAEGYCAGRGCATNGCDLDTEICADFGPSGRFAGEAFCLLTEDCEARGRTCGRPGMVCQELPVNNGTGRRLDWAMGCWVGGLSPIGGSCAADSDCVGGRCLTRDVAGATVTYCAAPCGEEAGCPSNSTCVNDRENPGEFLCLANANAADCPRLDSEPLFIRSSPPLERYDGGTTSVCFFAGR